MNEKVVRLITEYGLEAVILGLAINVLTGLIKLPIKAFAKKLEDGSKLTRYLVFLPVMLGFFLTLGYTAAIKGRIEITREFVTLWVSSSSLSLTFYALWEKLFPTKEKLKKEYIIEENTKLIEAIRQLTGVAEPPENVSEGSVSEENSLTSAETVKDSAAEAMAKNLVEEAVPEQNVKKIVLKGRRDGTETEAESRSA